MSLGSKGIWLITTILQGIDAKKPWMSLGALGSALSFVYYLAPGLLELTTLLHLEWGQGWTLSRRPANKRERDTRRSDGQFGWMVPGIVGVISTLNTT
jgi:hypothetical protein